MSALTDPIGFRLSTLVEAQREPTDEEVYRFLVTGEPPDLSEPPLDTTVTEVDLDAQVIPLSLVRATLAGDVPLIASSFLAYGMSHSVLLNGETSAFKYNPAQPRDTHGRWTDTPAGGSNAQGPIGTKVATTPLTQDEITARGRRLEKILQQNSKRSSDRLHATYLGPGKGVAWNSDRDRLHRQIVSDLYARADNVPNEGRSLIMGGPAGAGKTTTVQQHAGVDLSQYMIINPDDIKEVLAERDMIPEIPDHPELSPMERSTLVHAEAMRISAMLARRAYTDRKNVIWDITMGAQGAIRGHVRELREAGYETVDAIVVEVPPYVSRRRTYARYGRGVNDYLAGKGNGGRYIPRGPLLDQHNSRGDSWGLDTLNAMKSKFDSWQVYDNSVDGEAPKLIRKSGDE